MGEILDYMRTLFIYAVTAFILTGIVYLIMLVLGIYSIVLLVILIISTGISLSFILKRGGLWKNDIWVTSFIIPIIIFVVVSVVLAFFFSWMIWIAIPAFMLVLYITIVKPQEVSSTYKVTTEMIEMSRAAQGKPSWWGTPLYPLSRFIRTMSQDMLLTTYGFSLCALYICTTMIIHTFSLPLYVPLIAWGIFLAVLFLLGILRRS